MVVLLFSFLLFYFSVIKGDVAEKIKRDDVTGHIRQKRQTDLDLSETVFPPINTEQYGAVEVMPNWLALVKPTVPSGAKNLDLAMCTAVCVKEHIFITASRCLVTLRVPYTAIEYKGATLTPKAFIEPATPTKQMFNDISFIVTCRQTNLLEWHSIPVLRPYGDGFSWFPDYLKKSRTSYTEIYNVGYVSEIDQESEKMAHQAYYLPGHTSLDLCQNLLNKHYQVPCYFYCTTEQYNENKLNCQNYLRGLGHAIIQSTKGIEILIGIVTWAATDLENPPSGFAIPNSENYLKNFKCAENIADDAYSMADVGSGYYKSLCD